VKGHKTVRALAMQKVEGSSPFIRFIKGPANRAFLRRFALHGGSMLGSGNHLETQADGLPMS
jgi:hypothetical protein